jgi:phosphoglycolate phosphatase-like HAD superfamily hydrolase
MKKYRTLIFDCDGVILNSNKIKTQAFRNVLANFNQNAVNEFIEYHTKNGGVSRYIKLERFLNKIVPKYVKDFKPSKDQLQLLLKKYSYECKSSLCNCEITKGLEYLRKASGNIPWLIVSGGDQNELKEVFNYKNITKYFNGGIFGSPDKKIDIIKREISNGLIKFPALMLGDSKLDYLTAKSSDIDFLFVYEWTDFKDYDSYCKINSIQIIRSVCEVIKIFKQI